ncbi:amidase [Actinoplanes cyaneus]|uniref:Amidase n=1 Tax=Actinoplanes cyaneus TaxID=52696 RepID=A0A919IID8_9ACTN|nr:amidase [Actinoplanes cyaneus]MCW2136160.1 amidase [Actinoplanes cyaneus]GID62470.1 amidase [Actinoplanes cyaneus]
MDEIVHWTAAELSAAIRDRVVSCVEVMTAYLDHIDKINPAVNAIVGLRPRAELLAEAAEKDRGVPQGWMHGFPHAVKDLADVSGLTSSYGLVPPIRAAADSLFVERIRAAGAIFIGKTNVPQLGLGSQTYNDIYGTTLNAYDQTRTAGGSSGGAAVAVALRMLPVADGSDFMGSLRNPPGWNNVYGLRPSFGRVPSAGGDQFIAQGGVEGPIARTATDLELLFRTMSGYDARSPLALPDDDTRGELGRRVAWLGDLGGYLPMEPEVLTVTRAALDRLAGLGITVDTLDELPGLGNDALWPTWLTYRHWLAGLAVASVHDDPALRPLLKPEAIFEYEGLTRLSAIDVAENSESRSRLYEGFRVLFETYDYVVLPTAQVLPFDATQHWPHTIGGRTMSSYHRWMEVTTIGTLINAPVLAVPAGFSAGGLPIGLQIIGRNHDDRGLLEFAKAWESQTGDLQERRPPLLLSGP